jgi:hypothetical protein
MIDAALAWHEAGHQFVAECIGIDEWGLRIADNGDVIVVMEPPLESLPARYQASCLLGGAMAESYWSGANPQTLSELRHHHQYGTHDLDVVEAMIGNSYLTSEAVDQLVAEISDIFQEVPRKSHTLRAEDVFIRLTALTTLPVGTVTNWVQGRIKAVH